MLWIDIIRMILIVICHAFSLCILSEPKPSIKHPRLMWAAFAVALIAVGMIIIYPSGGFTSTTAFIIYFTFIIPCLVLFMLASDGPPKRNLFTFALYSAYFVLTAVIAELISEIFRLGPIAQALIRTSFSVLLIVFSEIRLRRIFRKYTEEIAHGWGRLSIFAVVSTLAMSIFSLTGMFFIADSSTYVVLMSVFIIHVLASFMLVFLIIKLLNERNILQMERYQDDTLRAEIETEKDFIETAIRYRHDLRHHDAVLLDFLRDGHIEDAIAYIEEHSASIDKTKIQMYSPNIIFNALLRTYARRCMENNIAFSADTPIPNEIDIPMLSISIIFGNLLENAFEAARKAEKPFMRISAEFDSGKLKAEVRNSMAGNIIWERGIPSSTKRNGGTGIKSAIAALDKHGGMLRMKQEGKMFLSEVIIPCSIASE